jgi:hypothetical protein
MGLNLHLTQKDPPIPKHQDKPKKNGHVHDVCHYQMFIFVSFHTDSDLSHVDAVSAKDSIPIPKSK